MTKSILQIVEDPGIFQEQKRDGQRLREDEKKFHQAAQIEHAPLSGKIKQSQVQRQKHGCRIEHRFCIGEAGRPARSEIMQESVRQDQDQDNECQTAAVKSPAQQKADSQNKIRGRPLDLGQPGSHIPLADTDQRRNKHQATRQEEAKNLS